jgi:hypothetical protein
MNSSTRRKSRLAEKIETCPAGKSELLGKIPIVDGSPATYDPIKAVRRFEGKPAAGRIAADCSRSNFSPDEAQYHAWTRRLSELGVDRARRSRLVVCLMACHDGLLAMSADTGRHDRGPYISMATEFCRRTEL